eukprot:7783916-Pyramimonas_sp.AAC.1
MSWAAFLSLLQIVWRDGSGPKRRSRESKLISSKPQNSYKILQEKQMRFNLKTNHGPKDAPIFPKS